MAARSERFTASALWPRSRADVVARRKCTPSTSRSWVTTAVPPTLRSAASSPMPSSVPGRPPRARADPLDERQLRHRPRGLPSLELPRSGFKGRGRLASSQPPAAAPLDRLSLAPGDPRARLWSGDDGGGRAGPGAARGGARGRRAGLRTDRRAAPARAPRPLLPDARLAARRRGRAPGHAAAGVAGPRGASRARRPRPWLYAIATNVCLDAGARRRRRILPMDHGPPAAPGADPGAPLEASVWIEPYPDGEVGIGRRAPRPPRPATSSASRSSWRSSRPCSTSRRAGGPC